MRLIDAQPAVFLLPPIIRLLGNPEILTGVEHHQALAGVELNRPQMLDAASGVYRFLGITVTSLVAVQSHANFHPGPDLPGQVSIE